MNTSLTHSLYYSISTYPLQIFPITAIFLILFESFEWRGNLKNNVIPGLYSGVPVILSLQ
jgi:hypothetical protein